MKLVLSFVHPTKPARIVGPFNSVRLDADSIRELGNGGLVACHRERLWEVEGEKYFRLDATSRIRIHFERSRPDPHARSRSRDFGPFERFSAVDGIAYTDNQVFAFVDSKVGDWFCYDDGRHWAVMIVTDAASRGVHALGLLLAFAPALPGVIGAWQDAKLIYVARAQCIRSHIESVIGNCDRWPGRVTAITWETHPDPAAREAELYAEHLSASWQRAAA